MSQQWTAIVHRHAADVHNAAFRVLGNSSDAEDVAQQVFLEAFQNDNDQVKNWGAFLRVMSVRRAIDVLRQQRTTSQVSSKIVDRTMDDPLSISIAADLKDRLRIAAAALPQRQSEVFCLICFEQLEIIEVAHQLGLTENATRVLLSKARKTLASEFLTQPAENQNG